MKADPEAQQQLQGIYKLEEPDGANLMALQIDYENMEESLRSMLHHNGQPTFNEKEDTTRQMHAYKNAISKFRNHISYVERENHALKTQIASLATHTVNGDTVTQHQRTAYVSEMSQLEDIRVTCVMLSERIKRMEEQNNILLMNAEKQRCDYEKCLDRVASQVFQTLSYQRRLQMECDALRMQVHHLTGTLPHSLPGSSRSSETSPNGQSTHGSAPDEVFNQYGNYMHVPYNVVANGYAADGNQSPYSPTFATRGEISPPVANISIANQKLPSAGMYERRGHYVNYNPQYQPLPRDHVQFNGEVVDQQYERQALSPHRVQTAKTPPLHAIPESIEPVSTSVQDLTYFRPRLPRSGSGMIAGPPSLGGVPSSFGPQRTAYDDEVVGRMSRSRDRLRPAERNKVVRSRSFDGHSSYGRTPPARQNRCASPKQPDFSPPSYRPGPPLHSVPVGQVDQRQTQKLRTEAIPPTGSKICSPKPGESVQTVHVGDAVPGDRQIVVANASKTSSGIGTSNPSSPTAHTGNASSLATQPSSTTVSQELRSTTVHESPDKPLSRGGLQRSFRVTRSCERREQRKTVDDVWLPRSGGPNEPMSVRVTNNRYIDNSKDSCDPSLPPPPPPPPSEHTVEDSVEEIAKSNTSSTDPSYRKDQNLPDPGDTETTNAARQKSQSLNELSVKSLNARANEMATSPPVSPKNYATFEALPRHDVSDEKSTVMDLSDDEAKMPQKSPTQLPPPNQLSHKKNTKREAPKPPNVTSPSAQSKLLARVARKEGISPSVSCETLSSSNNNTKDAPRRLSEGTVKEMGKKSRLAAPSQKKRIKEKQKPVADVQDANYISADSSSAHSAFKSSAMELSIKNRSPQSKKLQSPTRTGPKASPELSYDKYSNDASKATNVPDQLEAHLNLGIKSTKSAANNKSSNARSSSENDSREARSKDEIKIEKKTEAKKKSGNQKSFVDMMKSKFGGRGSGSKKAIEVQTRHDNAVQEDRKPPSVIDPRTLSLEPNSFPPENVGKKSSKKADHDPVGRKLSRPFLDGPVDGHVPPTTGLTALKTESSNRKGFLGRNNSKRTKNSRQNAFENGDHFNNVPYGRVELIPIGAPIPNPTELSHTGNNVGVEEVGATRQINVTETPIGHSLGVEIISNAEKPTESHLATRRQMNDYENVVILSELHKRKALSNDVAAHSYENVVIVNTAERNREAGHDAAQTPDQAEDETAVGETRIKQSTPKQPSPLQKLWTSFSNHSLNKMSGSESGSRTALHDIAKGRGVAGQPNSEKGSTFSGEQQMFEKAYISSVVEAELNSKEKREGDVVEMDDALGNLEESQDIEGFAELAQSPDYSSQVESTKSSMTTFGATESFKSSNSGFDSWPTKSTGPSSRIENPRGGSLDARFRDVKSIQEIEIGDQSLLHKRSMVDSRSSLGSYGYGSGVSGSSTTSSNKSRGLSPPRQNCEPTNARNFSSSDNDLASTPQPNSLQSRYAARKFASPIGNATSGNRLPKPQGLPKPKSSANAVRVKMGVSSISPPKSHNVGGSDRCTSQNGDPPKKLAPLSCNAKPSALPEVAISKNKETRRSGLPTRTPAGSSSSSSRFGVQRTSIPVRHSGSRMQHHAS